MNAKSQLAQKVLDGDPSGGEGQGGLRPLAFLKCGCSNGW